MGTNINANILWTWQESNAFKICRKVLSPSPPFIVFFVRHLEFYIKLVTCFTPINKGIKLRFHGHNQIDYNHQGIRLQHAMATLGPLRLVIANLVFLYLPLCKKIVALTYKFISNMIAVLANLVLTRVFNLWSWCPLSMHALSHSYLPFFDFLSM
jgi:hypothetical protein